MSSPEQRARIDANFHAFQNMLAAIIVTHRDNYALMRDREIVGYFAPVGDAYRSGAAKYPDGIFSIQEVTDQPIELGIYGKFFG